MEKTEFEFPHEVEEKTSRLGSKVVTPELRLKWWMTPRKKIVIARR